MPITSRFVVRSTIFFFAVGFIALLGIVGMTIWLGERAQVYFEAGIEARDTRISAVELRSAVQSAESAQRGFLVSGNEIYLAPYDSAKVRAERELERLKKALTRFEETEAMLQRLSAVVSEKIAEMDRSIALKSELRDSDALALFRTNRGKALMDEANVFLSGIIRMLDDRLTATLTEQRENAILLRWVSIVGGLIIVLVVAGVTFTVWRYAHEIEMARDEVRSLNVSLEQRVQQRTSELGRARDRAEALLAEVNHRVANSLSMVAGLVRLQANALRDRSAKEALSETQARIFAISSVHKRLYSSGDVHVVALGEYLPGLLDQLAASVRADGNGVSLRYEIDPISLRTDASINLGVIVTEWVTNAFKYAYPGSRGEVRVTLKKRTDGQGELVVEDDGVGRDEDAAAKGTGLGTRLVTAMTESIGGTVAYKARQPGTGAHLTFPLEPA